MIPEGITTALVHMDAPISFVGEPGRLHIVIEPSVSLIWTATGTPIGNFVDTLALDPGAELRIELPHTDQTGFQDAQGNTYTGWFYSITVVYERNGRRISFPKRDFQILTGQAEVDLALVPAGDAAPEPMVAPILPVTSIKGFTGEVTMVELGLDLVDNVRDADKPVSTATSNALNLKAPLASPTFTGTVGGITKAMVGLSAVDNTADADKPVSLATSNALGLKAPLASPTFTGTVSGISKSMVGLSAVNNTADADKPVSLAQQTALDAKAAKVSAVDFEITDALKGIILKSPNGTRHRITVADDGALTTTSL